MYAVTISDEGDCYRCFLPDAGIGTAALGASEAAALGASASAPSGTGEAALSGTASASASLTFTLDSGASRSFFRDRTTLTPLGRPVAVSLADPSKGPVLSHFSTVLPCPAAPSGTLCGLYLPSFSTNLVSGADLQDAGVHQFTPASQRVTHCSDARTGRHLATLTRRPGSRLYTPTTESPPVPASSEVAVSGQGLVLPTLHMDVCGPARVSGQGHERYFLPVVDDYSRYTTVFPLRSKGDVIEVLIDWIRGAPTCLRTSCPLVLLLVSSSASPDAPGWQFYHPSSRRVLSSQDVTFDESVPYYRLFPYRTPSLPPPPHFLVPGPPQVDPLPPQGLAPSGVSQVDAVEPVKVAGDSGTAAGAEPGGADSGGAARVGAELGGTAPGGAETRCAEPGGAATGGAELGDATAGGAEPGSPSPGGAESGTAEPGDAGSGAAEPGGAEPAAAGPARVASGGAGPGGSPGTSSQREPLSPQELREWFARRWSRPAGAGASLAAEGAGAAGLGGPSPGSAGAAGPTSVTGVVATEGVGAEATAVSPGGGLAAGAAGAAGGPAAGGAVGAGAAVGGAGAVPAVSGVAARPRRYFVLLLQQVLGLPPPLECPPPVLSQSQLPPSSPLPAPSPYTGPTGGLAERHEPASRPASPVRAAHTSGRGSRQRPPPVPGTHRMSLRPSTAPLRAPLPSPPESSLPALAALEEDSLRAASPIVTRLLATVITDPSFESTAASALVAELVDFAARCRLDYAASLVPEPASVCPPSVGGECALGTDVLEDRQEEFQCLAAASPHLASLLLTPKGDPDALDIPTPRSYAEAVEGPYSSQWQAAMDAEMASWKSTGTYVDAIPPPGANIVSGMWIFRVKRPPGSPPVFNARYMARGFR
ncbi:unnamed protein product [Closterium sp. NIES-65]|nr:unnamed protein product [Closterium sp. NIES-65]